MANSVLNYARWDKSVRQWSMVGGPRFSTQVVTVQSGNEQRASLWSLPLGKWNLGNRNVRMSEYQDLYSFFFAMKGKFYGFRVRDWTDFKDDGRGILGNGYGNIDGSLTYQLNKKRGINPNNSNDFTSQKITRPVGFTFENRDGLQNTITLFWNGSPQTFDQSQMIQNTWSLDDSTGTVTYKPVDRAVTAINGNIVTFASPQTWPPEARLVRILADDEKAYFIEQIIDSTHVSFYNLNKNLTGSFIAQLTPGDYDTLAWTGEYDVPARFDTDAFDMNAVEAFIEGGDPNLPREVWIHLGDIPVIQLRE